MVSKVLMVVFAVLVVSQLVYSISPNYFEEGKCNC